MSEYIKALNERFLLQEEYLGSEKPINKIEPLVSVTIATYQHKDYIRQCLDGVIMQKTTFPFEIIIGEDGSIDGTQEICKEYAEKYPDKIRLFIRDRKLSQFEDYDGSIKRFNGIWNRMSCRGKYIAWCEGDDYWIDPLKLQKQADFLENNSEYGLVYGKAWNFLQRKNKNISIGGERFIDAKDLIKQNRIQSLTVLFKKDLYNNYLDFIKEDNKSWKMGDYPIWIYFSLVSNIHYMDDVFAVYRILEHSASCRDSFTKTLSFIESEYDIRIYFNDKFNLGLDDDIKDQKYRSILSNSLIFNEFDTAQEIFYKINKITYKDYVKFIISKYIILQNIYKVIKKVGLLKNGFI